MSEDGFLKQAQATNTGGVVELRACREEDRYFAHFYTRQGVTLRWVAPLCAVAIESAYVELAMVGLDLIRIEMHPQDIATYNSTFLQPPAEVVLVQSEDGKTTQVIRKKE